MKASPNHCNPDDLLATLLNSPNQGPSLSPNHASGSTVILILEVSLVVEVYTALSFPIPYKTGNASWPVHVPHFIDCDSD